MTPGVAARFPRAGLATPHYLASAAGAAELARGGNAIDAVVAANLALGVVAPYLCGYGGDLFAIVWDGERTAFAEPLSPGEVVEMRLRLVGPRPPGPYRLAVDLIEEHRFWFAEAGSFVLEVPVDVAPRVGERRLGVVVGRAHDGLHGAQPRDARAALLDQMR